MSSILAILPRCAWPPRKSGFSVRFFPLLRHLAANHSLHLLVLGDRDAEHPEPPFGISCNVQYLGVAAGAPSLMDRLETLARGLGRGAVPYAMRSVWTPRIIDAVAAAGRKRRFDVALWAGPEYLEAALWVARNRPASRLVFDFVDSPTLIASRGRSGTSPAEVAGISVVETEIRKRADLSIYIAADDVTAATGGGQGGQVCTVPNGVYLDDLQAADALVRPHGLPCCYVLFFGHMSFVPNVDAACWLATEIMPRVRQWQGDIKLVIAGHQPAPAVRALAGEDTVITGSVDSIWPYVRHAAACVFPLRLASGLQNKILEALAVGKGVVTTRKCAASIGAISGEHLCAADSSEEIAAATVRLLQDMPLAERLGEAGRDHVRREFDWTPLAARYEAALLG